MKSPQLPERRPVPVGKRDEFAGSIIRSRGQRRGGTGPIVGACAGPGEAGAFGPGRGVPA